MATTIRIDDTVRPSRSNLERSATGFSNGIFPYRSQSRTSSNNRSRGRRGSLDKRSQRSRDDEAAEDEDSGLRHSGDFKKRQVQ